MRKGIPAVTPCREALPSREDIRVSDQDFRRPPPPPSSAGELDPRDVAAVADDLVRFVLALSRADRDAYEALAARDRERGEDVRETREMGENPEGDA